MPRRYAPGTGTGTGTHGRQDRPAGTSQVLRSSPEGLAGTLTGFHLGSSQMHFQKGIIPVPFQF